MFFALEPTIKCHTSQQRRELGLTVASAHLPSSLPWLSANGSKSVGSLWLLETKHAFSKNYWLRRDHLRPRHTVPKEPRRLHLVDNVRSRLQRTSEFSSRTGPSLACVIRVACGMLALVSSSLARSPRLIRMIDHHSLGNESRMDSTHWWRSCCRIFGCQK